MQISQTDIDRVKWSINQVNPAINKVDWSFNGLDNIITLDLFIDDNIMAKIKLRKIRLGIYCTNISFNDNIYSEFDEFKNVIYFYFLYDKNKNESAKLIDLTKFTFDVGLKNIILNMEFIYSILYEMRHIDSFYKCYKVNLNKEFVAFQWEDQEYTKPITDKIKRKYSILVTHDKCQLHLRVKLFQSGKEIDEYETILVNMNDFILIEKDPINPEKQIIVMYTEEEFKKLFGKVKLCQN